MTGWGRWYSAAIALAVLTAIFGDAIFRDMNFAFRDAGHFYYPYYKHIQDEWSAGRIPLWSAAENGGMPLAANPTACVFYPAKALFFILSYPQAFKWYHLGHLLLAAWSCWIAGRAWGLSPLAAGFAGISYAFSGFVLFQIYNIVFLVGAAWLPLGLLLVDRMVRSDSTLAVYGLAAVLAMQVLGGDPQIAYLTLTIGAFYAVFHACGLARGLLWTGVGLGAGMLFVQRSGIETIREWVVEGIRLQGGNSAAMKTFVGCAALACCGTALAAARIRKSNGNATTGGLPIRLLLRLVGAGTLAGALSAVQVLPTYEFVQHTDRAAPDAPHESAGFSFFPLRIVEWFAPSFFGRTFTVDSRWFPYESIETGVWMPDVYMGLATAALAIGAMRWRRGAPVEKLLTWIALLSLWAATGKFGLLRFNDDSLIGRAARGEQANPVLQAPGVDPPKLYGDADGLYRLLEESLPGFRSFRYPSKLLALTAVSASLLAGLGLDRLRRSDSRGHRLAFLGLAAAFFTAFALLWCFRDAFERRFARPEQRGGFGPLAVKEASRRVILSCLHSAAVAAGCAAILEWRRRRSASMRDTGSEGTVIAAVFLAGLGVDLALAHRWQALLDDQSVIDATPKVVEVIRREEAKETDPQPFRVHRTRIYHPLHWNLRSSETRFLEMSRWERDTIQPKYGIPFGIDYTMTVGTMSIYDVEFFFAPWTVATPAHLRNLMPNKPERMTYFPRVSYNLWNTKYFVLPKLMKIDDEDRGHFTFISTRDGAPAPILAESGADADDFIVIRNAEVMPRARIVHWADFRPPIRDLSRDARRPVMEELISRHLDAGEPLWRNPKYPEYPHDRMAMIETDDPQALLPFLGSQRSEAEDSVQFEDYQSDRLRLRVRLAKPGFVVLADTYYPGWRALVDGADAPVLRANRAMRAVGVPAGEHVLEMRYRCVWFEVGAAVSALAWISVAAAAWMRRTR